MRWRKPPIQCELVASPSHQSSAKCDTTTRRRNSPIYALNGNIVVDVDIFGIPRFVANSSIYLSLHMETATETEPHQSPQVTQKRQALRLRHWEILLLKVISRFSVLPLLASAPSVPTNDNKPTFPCHARRISCWNGLIFKKFANNFPF